jgi:hypothetical protein
LKDLYHYTSTEYSKWNLQEYPPFSITSNLFKVTQCKVKTMDKRKEIMMVEKGFKLIGIPCWWKNVERHVFPSHS